MTDKALREAAQAVVNAIPPVPEHEVVWLMRARVDALKSALAQPDDCPDCAEMAKQRDHYRARIRLLEAEQAEIYAALRADIPQAQIPSWAEAPAFKKGWAEAVQYVWYRVHRATADAWRGK